MAEQAQSGKGGNLNDRTYQEVEYLKKNLGPILVAALAEICIRRPADPIEYLGHWLLRWRYNEELKRRDVQNALEVVRQKAWTKDDESVAPPTITEPSNQASSPSPGFGGEDSGARKSEGMAPPTDSSAAASKRASAPEEKRGSQAGAGAAGSGGEMRRVSGEESRRPSEGAGRKTSGDPGLSAEPMDQDTRASAEQQASREVIDDAPSPAVGDLEPAAEEAAAE